LPLELNKEITVLLNEYGAKKKSGKLGVSVKLAAICGDEFTCLEAAEATYKAKDYFSAKNWLNIGGVDSSNPIYGLIEKKIKETRQALLENVTIQVIDVKGCSLVPAINPDLAYAELKKDCSRIALESQERWKKGVRKIIETILKKQKEEERRLEIEKKDRKDKRKEIIIFLFFLIGIPLVGCLVDNRFELKFILLGAFFGLMAYVLCILFRMAIIEIKERLNI
jgi:hypothetical protein